MPPYSPDYPDSDVQNLVWDSIYLEVCKFENFKQINRQLFNYIIHVLVRRKKNIKLNAEQLEQFFWNTMVPALYTSEIKAKRIMRLYRKLEIKMSKMVQLNLENRFSCKIWLHSDDTVADFCFQENPEDVPKNLEVPKAPSEMPTTSSDSQTTSSKVSNNPTASQSTPAGSEPPTSFRTAPAGVKKALGGPTAPEASEAKKSSPTAGLNVRNAMTAPSGLQVLPSNSESRKKGPNCPDSAITAPEVSEDPRKTPEESPDERLSRLLQSQEMDDDLKSEFWELIKKFDGKNPALTLTTLAYLMRLHLKKDVSKQQIKLSINKGLEVPKTSSSLVKNLEERPKEVAEKSKENRANLPISQKFSTENAQKNSISHRSSAKPADSNGFPAKSAERTIEKEPIRPISPISRQYPMKFKTRSPFTVQEEIAAWDFIYRTLMEQERKKDKWSARKEQDKSPKGMVIWNEFVKQSGSKRTATSWNSHFRKKMVYNLHSFGFSAEKMLYLYDKCGIWMTMEVRDMLEEKFAAQITIADGQVIYYDLNPNRKVAPSPKSPTEKSVEVLEIDQDESIQILEVKNRKRGGEAADSEEVHARKSPRRSPESISYVSEMSEVAREGSEDVVTSSSPRISKRREARSDEDHRPPSGIEPCEPVEMKIEEGSSKEVDELLAAAMRWFSGS